MFYFPLCGKEYCKREKDRRKRKIIWICYFKRMVNILLVSRAMQKLEDKTESIVDFTGKKFIFAANKFPSTFLLIYLKSMCQVVKLRGDKHLFKTTFSIKFPDIQKLM